MIFNIYSTKNRDAPLIQEWYWTLNKVVGNTQISASTEGFETKELCEANIHLVMLTDYNTPIIEVKEKKKSNRVSDFFESNG